MRIKATAMAVVAAGCLLAAGCGSDDSGSGSGDGGGKKAATVGMQIILDKTGIASFANIEADKGVRLAIDQINADKLLGDTKVTPTYSDAASDQRQAVQRVSKAVKQDPAVIVFGTQSAESLAVAPIAQRAKIPMVLLASGAADPGKLGDYIFRATVAQPQLAPLQSAYFKSKGVKTVAIVSASDSPVFKIQAQETYPDLAKKDGYEIVHTSNLTQADTDFSSDISTIMSKKPDAVIALLTGTQVLPFLSNLQRAGYQGLVGGQPGMGSGTLKPLGQKAKGAVWPTDFSSEGADAQSSKDFDAAYKAKYNADPTPYAAEGFDAVMFAANGLKEASSFDPTAVRDGLLKAAGTGVDVATGHLTFEERDARTKGIMVTWDGTKEVPAQ